MQTTDPPVKVLLADGIHKAGVGTMEQLPLVYFLPSILFLHLPFLPRMVETCMKEDDVDHQRTASWTHFLKRKEVSCDQKKAVASLTNSWRLKPQSTEWREAGLSLVKERKVPEAEQLLEAPEWS